MLWTTLRCTAAGLRRLGRRRSLTLGLSFGCALMSSGCGLLDVNDPTGTDEEELANAESANLMRRAALWQLVGYSPRLSYYGAMLTDEFFRDQSGPSQDLELVLDQRDQALIDVNPSATSNFLTRTRARLYASHALEQLRQYGAAATRQAYIGQMFAVDGYSILGLAEHHCAGFPLGELHDGRLVFTAPLTTTAAVLEQALAAFDSAVIYTADSVDLLHAARVGRARALLGLGRFADAATAAAEAQVPTDFAWVSPFTGYGLSLYYGQGVSVADREGGIGLDYVSAHDPRVSTDSIGMAVDGVTTLYRASKYSNALSPFVLANGIEARLIEAEARLNTNPGGSEWLTILNTLRTAGTQMGGVYDAGTGGVAGLAPLTDPGTDAARLDLIFRERAFWLYGTGHRLGDLRRLVRLYHRDPESVFPTGAYRLGGQFGVATSLPFDTQQEAQQNPAVTGCTER